MTLPLILRESFSTFTFHLLFFIFSSVLFHLAISLPFSSTALAHTLRQINLISSTKSKSTQYSSRCALGSQLLH